MTSPSIAREVHTPTPTPPPVLRAAQRTAAAEAVEDVLYGSIAGIVGKYIEYPFDTVKVRLQSQPDRLPLKFNGPLDCFRQSIRADGVLGLYRGISAPLVGAAVETSSLFFFERLARELVFISGYCPRGELLPLPALWATGAMAGAFTSFLLTPIELVKCKIQVPDMGAQKAPLKPLAVIKDVFRHHGLAGFWRGQTGTLIREAGGSAAWFGSKETTSKLMRDYNMRNAASYAEREALSTSPLPLWQQALAGASAGMSYNFLFFPADTIKSRMQTAPFGKSTVNHTFWTETTSLWRQSGLRGFYRGCGITVARSAPSSAFIFMVYDGMKTYIPMAS